MDSSKVKFNKDIPFDSFIDVPTRGNISCPFHGDNHPSARFYNDDEKGLVLYCFSCRKQYTSFDYVNDILQQDPYAYYKKRTGHELEKFEGKQSNFSKVKKISNFNGLIEWIKNG